jgi:excisionase family DNA binding protein
MTIEVKLAPEQLPLLARLIAREMGAVGGMTRTKPYDVKEAAAALGVSPDTVRRRVAAGLFKSVPDAGRVLIPAAEIERLLSAKPEGGNER